MFPDEDSGLTAAECAARTGLTVRALRVYEEYGLITPGRTPGGWRCYGKRDLIRLNSVSLLKSAGLTLAQISTVTDLRDQDPSLRQLLEIQVENWKTKKIAAERGQALAETALKSLETHDSLSIDELCNLVRSMEMSNERPLVTASSQGEHRTALDPTLLEKYVGCYRLGMYSVLAVTRAGGQLFGQIDGELKRELIAESETEFTAHASSTAHSRFVVEADGRVSAVVIHQDGLRLSAARIDAATAEEIRANLQARIASQAPLAGSEAALRRLLEGIDQGEPNCTEMTGGLADLFRHQLPQLQAISRYLGPLQSLEFQGVGSRGWDVFQVQRRNGSTQWRILVTPDGRIESASATANDPSFMPSRTARKPDPSDAAPLSAPTSSERPAAAALRRLVEGIRAGEPDYTTLSPALGHALRQQMPMLQTIARKMGAISSITHVESVTETYDVFEVRREHGTSRWRISLAPDGTIANAAAMVTGSAPSAGP